MSRLPKLPTPSGLPAPSGLPTSGLQPPKKRSLSTSSPAKPGGLTPEQEALLQEAMKKFNPEASQKTSTPTQNTQNVSSLPSHTSQTPGQQSLTPPSGQLRKPGNRKQSVSKMTRPAFPALSETQTLPTPTTTTNSTPQLTQSLGPRKLSPNQAPSTGSSNTAPSSLQMRTPSSQTQVSQLGAMPNSLTAPPKNNRLQAIAQPPQRPASPSLSLYTVGERVTVESMNLTGTVRFLGPLDIKPGTWAGIELDVPGTGKNDGSVNGVSYFTCPPKTGIFVLATKLSKPKKDTNLSEAPQITTPSVNKSTLSIPRPPSAASNSSDKSSTNLPTPGLTKNAQHAAMAAARITAGSRASKYIGITALQLKQKSTTFTPPTPTPDPDNPPSKLKMGLARPNVGNLKPPGTPPVAARRAPRRDSTSSSGSTASGITPQSNHQPSLGISRTSRATTPNEQNELQTPLSDSETNTASGEMTNKSLQEKIQKILNDSDVSESAPISMFDQQALRIQQLQMKIEILEAENTNIKLENKKSTDLERGPLSRRAGDVGESVSGLNEQWEAEKKALNARIDQLTKQLEDSSKGHHHRPSTSLSMLADDDNMNDKILQLTELVESKDEAVKSLEGALNKANQQSEKLEATIKGLEKVIKEQSDKIKELTTDDGLSSTKSAQDTSAKRIAELEKGIEEKALEIGQLVLKLDQAELDSEAKVRALQETVDEFKSAGQETINIYEEKVSALSQQIEDLKKAGSETITLYEDVTEKLADREAKIISLEKEAEELRSAGVEAIDVYEKTIEDFKKEMEEVKHQLAKKDDALNVARKEIETLKTVQRELSEANSKLEMKDKREEGLRNELFDLQNGFEQMMRADAKSRERIYQLEDEVRESQAVANRQNDEIVSLKSNIQELMNSNSTEEVEKVKSVLESEVKRLEEELGATRKTVSDIQAEKRTAVGEIDSLKDEKTLLEKKMQDGEQKRSLLLEELDAVKVNVKNMENEKDKLSKELEELQIKARDTEEEKIKAISSMETEKAVLIEARNATLVEFEGLREQLEELASKASQCDKFKQDLEGKSTELQNLTGILEATQNENMQLKTVSEIENKNFENEINGHKLENDQLKQKIRELALSAKENPEVQAREQEISDKIAAYEEQVAGLKHMVHELTRENVVIAGENKKILAEQEKLMEAHKQVENECLKLMDELERLHSESLSGQGMLSMPAAGFALSGESPGDEGVDDNSAEEDNEASQNRPPVNGHSGADLTRLQSLLAEKQAQLDRMKALHGSEIRDLRQKFSEVEKSKQRELNTLTKDVAELESLVESKIFREADLEEELQRERQTSKRLRNEIDDLKEQLGHMGGVSGVSTKGVITRPNGNADPGTPMLYCEICEESGHDIIHCKAVFGSNNTTFKGIPMVADAGNGETERPYCEYCEASGDHVTEDCPLQDEVF